MSICTFSHPINMGGVYCKPYSVRFAELGTENSGLRVSCGVIGLKQNKCVKF